MISRVFFAQLKPTKFYLIEFVLDGTVAGGMRCHVVNGLAAGKEGVELLLLGREFLDACRELLEFAFFLVG